MTDSPRYDEALPIALLRAREATLARFRRHVGENGLSLEQWRVIRALAEQESLTTRQLSDLCVLLPPSLSRILKALEASGLVTIRPGNDRRIKVSSLTEKGRKLFEIMIVGTQEIHAEIRELVGHHELNELIERLSNLRDSLQRSV